MDTAYNYSGFADLVSNSHPSATSAKSAPRGERDNTGDRKSKPPRPSATAGTRAGSDP